MRLLSLAFLLACSCVPAGDKDDLPHTDEPVDSGDSSATDADGDGFDASTDCDDTNAAVHPDADEICDEIDNNCDGATDDDDPAITDQSTWYADTDGDGFGDSSAATLACDQPSDHVNDDTDCDDNDAAFHPGAAETDCADPADYNCDGSVGYEDADGDNAPACEDCNDDDATLQVATAEVCDDIDNDCDGTVDNDASDATTWYGDADGDGYGGTQFQAEACDVPAGYVANSDDCDDVNAASYPGASEICDGWDNDCDNTVDEGVLTTWYADADGDGYGDPSTSADACHMPPGYSPNGDDCNDANAGSSPAALEVCDGADNDCDGTTDESDALDAPDWYADTDADGYGDPASSQAACSAPSGHVADATDCDPSNSAVHPGATEVCNAGTDDNCNGFSDDNDPFLDTSTTSTWYTDSDADGYGDSDTPFTACSAPSGTVADNTDCDDENPLISPAAAEICNDWVDDDCDGLFDYDDPGLTGGSSWYSDSDGDGYGDPNTGIIHCEQTTDYVADNTDCDDTSSSIHPGATEVCNGGVDDDCNTLADDDDTGLDVSTASTWYADTDSDGEGDANVSAQACSAPSGYVANADDCDDTDGTNANCGCPEIPSNVTTALAGPHDQHGFCWYLGQDGNTCDATCSDLSGSNLADDVATAFPASSSQWPDSCGTPNSGDVVTWFYNNGNAGGWGSTGNTSYHTLGYGYRNSQYYGKCVNGSSNGHGTFPGDPNPSTNRNLICPCFAGQ
jgi:hypothetical protein